MFRRIGLCAVVLALLGASPATVFAAPAAQGGCSGNVLRNPGFEEGFTTRGAGEVEVAVGWDPWWHNGSDAEVNQGLLRRPEYKPESLAAFGARRIHSGNWAQKWFTTYATHSGGLFQRVSVATDSQVTFSVWAQAWSSQDPNPDTVVSPGEYRVSVGIDPTGGTDGNSPNVIWSPEVVQYNTWIQLTVGAKAKGDAVTVFMRGRPEYRTHFNDSYWDDACLTVAPPTPLPTAPPPPTPLPTATRTPTVTPTITPTPTPRPGSIRVFAFQDYNRNGQRDEGDALLPGATFTVTTASGAAVGTYTTDGLSEPRAFSGLQPGAYQVTAVAPLGYLATSANSWTVTVEAGAQTDVGLGADFMPTATPTKAPSATLTLVPTRQPTATPTPIAIQRVDLGATLYNNSGLILLALAAVMLGLVLMAQRRGRGSRA